MGWYLLAALAAVVLAAGMIALSRLFAKREAERSIRCFQADLLEKHYQEVEQMYRRMRGWRHDYRNHIQTMKAYLAQKDYGQLDTYLTELAEDLTSVDTLNRTGNAMIDAILNSKISAAREKAIRITAKAMVPKEIECSGPELCVIVGNLMDNATEACMRLPDPKERFIRVYIDVIKGRFYLCITNSTDNSMKVRDGVYYSTKTGQEHGFGLVRVDDVVKRYGGVIKRRQEEGVFATEITMPLRTGAPG